MRSLNPILLFRSTKIVWFYPIDLPIVFHLSLPEIGHNWMINTILLDSNMWLKLYDLAKKKNLKLYEFFFPLTIEFWLRWCTCILYQSGIPALMIFPPKTFFHHAFPREPRRRIPYSNHFDIIFLISYLLLVSRWIDYVFCLPNNPFILR